MLAQQVPLLGRHVPVAAALLEIRRHCRARGVGAVIRWLRALAAGHPARRSTGLLSLRMGEVRRMQTGKRERQHQCNPRRSHDRPRLLGRFVPFVTRQPATSGT
ncbi:protein of unknown function [Burkholderia multivorans]